MSGVVDKPVQGAQSFFRAGVAYIGRFVRPAAMPFHISFAVFPAIPFSAGNTYPAALFITAKMLSLPALSGFAAVIAHEVVARNEVAVFPDLSGNSRRMAIKIPGDPVEGMLHAEPDLNGMSVR